MFDAATLEPLVRHAIPGDRTALTMTSAGDVLVTSGPHGIALIDLVSGTVSGPLSARGRGVLVARIGRCPRHHPVRSERTGHPLSTTTGSPAGPPVTLQTDEPPMLTLHGDGDELLMVDSTTIFRSRVDGSGPVSRLIAAGRDLAAGFGGNGSLIVTGGRDGGGMQVWDVERDLPVGSPAHFLRWLSDDLIFRADGSGESISHFDGTSSGRFPSGRSPRDGLRTSASRRRHPATRHICSAPAPCKGSIRRPARPRASHCIGPAWNSGTPCP